MRGDIAVNVPYYLESILQHRLHDSVNSHSPTNLIRNLLFSSVLCIWLLHLQFDNALN